MNSTRNMTKNVVCHGFQRFLVLVLVLLLRGPARSQVIGFHETFNGNGTYSSVDGELTGFDNPGWNVDGNSLEISEAGLRFANFSTVQGEFDSDKLSRSIIGIGSFSLSLRILNLDLGEIPFNGNPDHVGGWSLLHQLGPEGGDRYRINLLEDSETEDNSWILAGVVGRDGGRLNVKRGTDMLIGISYTDDDHMVAFSYDDDVTDEKVPVILGPFVYDGSYSGDGQFVELFISATGSGEANGILNEWSLFPMPMTAGDLNGDGMLNVGDVHLLQDAILDGSSDVRFDLTGDSSVDQSDLTSWVHDLKQTYFGDANLDGEFNSTDLVFVFGAGEYEDNIGRNSTWSTGDWNADGDFTTGDLVLAFQDGGYEQGPRAASAVPEPSLMALLLPLIAYGARFRRH